MKQPTDEGDQKGYSAAVAARVSGLSLDMVNYLCREKIVEPSASSQRGRGIARRYSFGDIVALRLVARLTSAGISVSGLKKGLRRLRTLDAPVTLKNLPSSHAITDGKSLYILSGKGSIERAFDGQMAFGFVVELSSMQSDVAKQLGLDRSFARRSAA